MLKTRKENLITHTLCFTLRITSGSNGSSSLKTSAIIFTKTNYKKNFTMNINYPENKCNLY